MDLCKRSKICCKDVDNRLHQLDAGFIQGLMPLISQASTKISDDLTVALYLLRSAMREQTVLAVLFKLKEACPIFGWTESKLDLLQASVEAPLNVAQRAQSVSF